MKFLIVLAVLAAVGWYYLKPLPPGKGPEAAKGMKVANMVAGAIESYRSARGMYPPTLDDIVPEYLGKVPHMAGGSTLEYQRLGPTYKLSFGYANPLPVHCSMQAGTKWTCEWF
jgi:hypothetical protein